MISIAIPGQFKNQTVTLTRHIGSYVEGVWVVNTVNLGFINVSVQPVSPSNYRLLPEGAAPQLAVEVFWHNDFQMGINGQLPDEITDENGVIYRCLTIEPWTFNGHNAAIFMTTEQNPYS